MCGGERPVLLHHRVARQLLGGREEGSAEGGEGCTEDCGTQSIPPPQDIYTSRCRKRASCIMKDPTHTAHALFVFCSDAVCCARFGAYRDMAPVLCEAQVRCCICLDIFTDPVSIPCGHNFCIDCIEGFWDTKEKSECPLCKEKFRKRPELRINKGFAEIVEIFKRSLSPSPTKEHPNIELPGILGADDMPCDICHGDEARSVKSCLDCQTSYCELHLSAHLKDPAMQRHRLKDRATFPTRGLCRKHSKPLTMFCKRDQMPLCEKCAERDHKYHETVHMVKESKKVKAHLNDTKASIQQMIQARLRKMEQIKKSVDQSRKITEQEIQSNTQVCTMLINAIERQQAWLAEELQEKQLEAEGRAEELLDELEQEIFELHTRGSELHHLQHSQNHLHILQSSPSLSRLPSTKDWSEVAVHSDNCMGTVRRAVSKLVDICQELEKKLCAKEADKLDEYAVDVTLDPETASGWLVLSPDRKKVSLSNQKTKAPVPDNPLRFDSCVCVLGKQKFTSGRGYWVVQVGDKTDWDLGKSPPSPSTGRAPSWCVPTAVTGPSVRRKGGNLSVCTSPSVTLHLQEAPQKVGIFLDYEEGLVSFYDEEAKTHIYTYSGCNFTESLHPYFNPCVQENGRNAAPLVICPVEGRIREGQNITIETDVTHFLLCIGGLANEESDYRQEVEHLEGWCRQNNLCINVKKTKEMIVDFRRGRHLPSPLYIGGTAVEVVSSFRYLGVHISDDLTWSNNTSCLIRKAHQRPLLPQEAEARRAGELSPDLLLQMCGGERPVLLHHRVARQLLGGREEGSAEGGEGCTEDYDNSDDVNPPVSLSNQKTKAPVPDNPLRFDSCVCVLGKQKFTSGRGYWVVQVGDKTDWDLGVATESINRKGSIMEAPQKVGIFLDYEEGLVSFYDEEAKTHIYTYSGCNFTESLHPYFNPCVQENGRNAAPLVICPVEGRIREGQNITIETDKGQTPPHSPVHRRDCGWKWSPASGTLGVHISDDLTWSNNTSCLIRKAHQRLHFLMEAEARRAGELSPDLLLQMCGGERPVLLHHRVARQLLGGREEGSAEGGEGCTEDCGTQSIPPPQDIYTSRCRKRASCIMKDPTHTAHALFVFCSDAVCCARFGAYRDMAPVLCEAQVRCCICLDIFTDPVSIPCGHNFCIDCIEGFWDTKEKSECPLCKEKFRKRPELRINKGFAEIVEIFKRSLPPSPTKEHPNIELPGIFGADDVPCDICHGDKARSVKSCLDCQTSYCELHLSAHLKDPAMQRHRLKDRATFPTRGLCRKHSKPLTMFCKRDQMPLCEKCAERDHKYHETVHMVKESKKVKAHLKDTKASIQQMIQARLRKMEQIKKSVDQSRKITEQEIQSNTQVCTMLINAIERQQAWLAEELQEKQLEAEGRAEELLDELEQEIFELHTRGSELHHLQHSQNHLHILQSSPSLSRLPSTKDWSEVAVHSDNCMGTVRRAVSKLVDICQELEKKLCAKEADKLDEYAVDVTLDPETASGWLVLSPDRKKLCTRDEDDNSDDVNPQVSLSNQKTKAPVPDNPLRFDSCVCVLGKQKFTSGRGYWVVQVGDKTDWDLGIATESINRKGSIMVRPDSGYWAICRRKGGNLSVCTSPSVTLHLQEAPQKVGIFLDYEEGLVSFYDEEAKTHIYTYSGCDFTESLHPYFNPCVQENGRNAAPLVICPQLIFCYVSEVLPTTESDYRQEVEHLEGWCRQNNLCINVKKTKEMIVDFRRGRHLPSPLYIGGTAVEVVSSFRYLGVHISDDLTWSKNTSCLIRKAHQRLYFLRRLRRAGLGSSVLTSFYRCVVESVLSSCIIVWHGSCSAAEKKALQRVVKAAQRTVGCSLPTTTDIYTSRCRKRASCIMKDPTHAAHALFVPLPSGRTDFEQHIFTTKHFGFLTLMTSIHQVSLSNQKTKAPVPDNPLRFDSCVCVLGKQKFTSGRVYWVVQVGDKTDWDLGIATESINRKGSIMVRPDSGYWAICRRKGGNLSVCTSPSVTLHLQEAPQKVGIFLDYEEGLVSFYDEEAKTHIYTYSGCNFTESLHPYFNPCVQENGRNAAPLVICPVEGRIREGQNITIETDV
ncbi:hypothetical protein L3Q82_016730 [Scortum barcoo]|uniref:Uncharacterized protein n=1 Tax=Scortum barcoo TaxID=214431 RepID=A0ACB8X8D0_9TELE|nr:hypothetical protein L3Q82_016730 [Scortum barcoo]